VQGRQWVRQVDAEAEILRCACAYGVQGRQWVRQVDAEAEILRCTCADGVQGRQWVRQVDAEAEILRCACAYGVQGRQWVRLVVLGQSFMMHQIRKMVATALAVFRGAAPPDAIPLALSPRRRVVRAPPDQALMYHASRLAACMSILPVTIGLSSVPSVWPELWRLSAPYMLLACSSPPGEACVEDSVRVQATPLAPELGLFLDECIFEAYNDRWGADREATVRLSAFQAQMDAFKAS
jgi:hypothetical protein